MRRVKIGKLYQFDGLKRVEVQEATIGDIVAVSGIADLHIGDTICSPGKPGIHSVPEDFRANNLHELPCKRQSSCRTGR